MNGVHIHLAINHLPLAALIFGIPILILSIFKKNKSYSKIGFSLLLIASLSSVAVYFSGEAAEEIMKNKPGIQKMIIEEHSEYGEVAIITLLLLGALCVMGHFRFKDGEIPNWYNGTVLFIAASSLFLAGNAALHGGHIMHPEVRGAHHHSVAGAGMGGMNMEAMPHGDGTVPPNNQHEHGSHTH